MPEQRLSLVRSVSGLGTRISVGIIGRDEVAYLIAESLILFGEIQFHAASPFFAERADFALERPGVARLLIDLPIGLGDRRRPHQPAGIEIGERRLALPLLDPLAHPCGIDAGVDDQMGDMDALRTELARGTPAHRAQAEFGAGKGGIADPAAQARGGAGKEDVAAAARQHQPRRLAPGQETGIAGHLPDLAEHPLGGLEQREIDIGADVEDADLERCCCVGVVEEGRDLLLLARIERAPDDPSARRLDLRDQRRQLVAVPPAGEDGETLRRRISWRSRRR